MTIIGITGTLGAGKGEVSAYLQKKGFKHFSVRDFLTGELKVRGLPINRDEMTLLANELRKTHAPSYIMEELYARAAASGKNVIIESVRAIGEADFLKANGALLIAVDADSRTRYRRILKRNSDLDHVSYEKFLSDEKREMDSAEPNRGNIRDCMRRADFIFENNGTREGLYAQVDAALAKI